METLDFQWSNRKMKLKAALFMASISFVLGAKEVFEFRDCVRLDPKEQKTLVFPVADAEKRQIRLHLTARFDSKNLGGYTFGMKIFVNGLDVNGMRLLNKPLAFRTRNGGGTNWSGLDRNRWNIMYSPDFSDRISTDRDYIYGLYEEEQKPYDFVFDITGLTSHGKDNSVLLVPQYGMPVVFRNVHVEIDENVMPRINEPKTAPAPSGALPDRTLKPLPSRIPFLLADSNGAAAPFGLRLVSSFSLPGGKFMNVSGTKDSLRPVSLPWKFEYRTPECLIRRIVTAENGSLKFTDAVTNLKNETAGLRLRMTLQLPSKPSEILRGGVSVVMKSVRSPANPTVFARTDTDGIGILLEDDVLRVQSEFSGDDAQISFTDDFLGIPPGGTHKLEWRVYSLPGGDYYDFVNTIRHGQNSNFTWHGPQAFPYFTGGLPLTRWCGSLTSENDPKTITESDVKAFLAERPVKVLVTHVPADYKVSPAKATRAKPHLGHGTAIPQWKWWCNMTRKMAKAFGQYAPDVKVYGYLHKNLCSEPGRDGKYQDSAALDMLGRRLPDSGYCSQYVPTLANSYGKKLAEVYRYLADDVGVSIYMDEISVGVSDWAPYSEWDGCTVEMDPNTNSVKRKLSIPNLLIRGWLEEMLAFLKSRNRELLANTPPYTRTLQRHRLLHFVEAGCGDAGLKAAHLSTPLAEDYSRGVPGLTHYRESLKSGALGFSWSGPWSEISFPFTPIEIRPGWLIGRERIVTAVSGIFGWNDMADAEVFVFDSNGNSVQGMHRRIVKNGAAFYEIRMPGDYIAVIVRKEFLPKGWRPLQPQKPAPPVKDATEGKSGAFDSWVIVDGALREKEKRYLSRSSDMLKLHAEDRWISVFDPNPRAASKGETLTMTFDVSGHGVLYAGVIRYGELPWKKPSEQLRRIELQEKQTHIMMDLPLTDAGIQGVRPMMRLWKDGTASVGNFRLEKKITR